MKALPAQRETVDMTSGEVIKTEAEQFTILPAPDGTCPDCASKREHEMAHNATSHHYQCSFYAEHGRWPTWLDAMAHCDEQMRATWKAVLIRKGVDVDGGKLRPEVDP